MPELAPEKLMNLETSWPTEAEGMIEITPLLLKLAGRAFGKTTRNQTLILLPM